MCNGVMLFACFSEEFEAIIWAIIQLKIMLGKNFQTDQLNAIVGLAMHCDAVTAIATIFIDSPVKKMAKECIKTIL